MRSLTKEQIYALVGTLLGGLLITGGYGIYKVQSDIPAPTAIVTDTPQPMSTPSATPIIIEVPAPVGMGILKLARATNERDCSDYFDAHHIPYPNTDWPTGFVPNNSCGVVFTLPAGYLVNIWGIRKDANGNRWAFVNGDGADVMLAVCYNNINFASLYVGLSQADYLAAAQTNTLPKPIPGCELQ